MVRSKTPGQTEDGGDNGNGLISFEDGEIQVFIRANGEDIKVERLTCQVPDLKGENIL